MNIFHFTFTMMRYVSRYVNFVNRIQSVPASYLLNTFCVPLYELYHLTLYENEGLRVISRWLAEEGVGWRENKCQYRKEFLEFLGVYGMERTNLCTNVNTRDVCVR